MNEAEEIVKGADNRFTPVDWQDIDIKLLQYNGIDMYPIGTRIQVLPIDLPMLRYFTAVNETDPRSVNDALDWAIEHAVRVIDSDGKHLRGNSCYLHDRFRLVLLIRRYSDLPTSINYTQKCCKKDVSVSLEPENLIYEDVRSDLSDMFDENIGAFHISTKKCGEVYFFPMTIKMQKSYMDYAANNDELTDAFGKMLPLLNKPENFTLDMKVLFDRFLNLSKEQLGTYNLLLSNLKVAGTLYVKAKCPTCGNDRFQMELPNGIANVFSAAVSLDDIIA